MMSKRLKISFVFSLLAIVLVACAPLAEQGTPQAELEEEVEVDAGTVEPVARSTPTHMTQEAECEELFAGEPVQFSTRFWEGRTNFCLHSVPFSQFQSGGPPPDGIPAIDIPEFESIERGDEWLEDDWPVMFFEHNDDARAYPLAILIWHEIVNDEVGGKPVALTFCPLCNATIAFDRTLSDGTVLDFGTTGNLRNSDLVMYDRQTFSWWQQFTGEAIVGDLLGTQLELLPSQIIAWEDFKQAHPEGKVLSRETGHVRSYGRNPYAGYDSVDGRPFFPVEGGDNRLSALERVVAIELHDKAVVYPFSALQQLQVVNDAIASQPVAVFWESGTKSTFGNNGPDIGSTGVFSRELDGEVLSFESASEGEGFMDLQTGTQWNLLGQALEGPLEGAELTRIVSAEHFWFAWAAFKPESEIRGIR
ncbi:MAG: DUF3179 domain-containing protein [Anaerolineales bacterium]|jgi:hypothetical protein